MLENNSKKMKEESLIIFLLKSFHSIFRSSVFKAQKPLSINYSIIIINLHERGWVVDGTLLEIESVFRWLMQMEI